MDLQLARFLKMRNNLEDSQNERLTVMVEEEVEAGNRVTSFSCKYGTAGSVNFPLFKNSRKSTELKLYQQCNNSE